MKKTEQLESHTLLLILADFGLNNTLPSVEIRTHAAAVQVLLYETIKSALTTSDSSHTTIAGATPLAEYWEDDDDDPTLTEPIDII